jgi:hypothetical protein
MYVFVLASSSKALTLTLLSKVIMSQTSIT